MPHGDEEIHFYQNIIKKINFELSRSIPLNFLFWDLDWRFIVSKHTFRIKTDIIYYFKIISNNARSANVVTRLLITS